MQLVSPVRDLPDKGQGVTPEKDVRQGLIFR